MELLCIQSQEHPELPLAELKAVMECENIDAKVDSVTEGLVILKDISDDDFEEKITEKLDRQLERIKNGE